jgi:hypothetical protein
MSRGDSSSSILDAGSTRALNYALIPIAVVGVIFAIIAIAMVDLNPTRGMEAGPGIAILDQQISLARQPPGTIMAVASSGFPATPVAMGPFGAGSIIQGNTDDSLSELPIGKEGAQLTVRNGLCAWFHGPQRATLVKPTSSSGVFGPGTDAVIFLEVGGFDTNRPTAVTSFSVSYTWVSDGVSQAETLGSAIVPLKSVLPSGWVVDSTTESITPGSGAVIPANAATPLRQVIVSAMFGTKDVTLNAATLFALQETDHFTVGASGSVALKRS